MNELKQLKNWVLWRLEHKDGKPTKVPYSLNGQHASSTNEETWATYEQVTNTTGYSGIGFVLPLNSTILGIDMDHCVENGEIKIANQELEKNFSNFYEKANTYAELSPSKTGIRLFFKLTEPLVLKANNKKFGLNKEWGFECYTSKRFLTITENIFKERKEIRIITPTEAENLLSIVGYPWKTTPTMQMFNPIDNVLNKMFASKNGEAIKRLWNGDLSNHNGDDSAADMALCSHLAFWTKNNQEQMRALWLSSPLGHREKTQNRKDYQDRTIGHAVSLMPSKEISTANGHPVLLKNLLTEELGEVQWLAKPLIAANGITILSGAPGQYKTFLSLHLALCFAEGSLKAFGNFDTGSTQPVMIVDEENNRRRLQTRLKSMGAKPELPIYFHILENIKLNESTARMLLAEMKELGVKIAFFDSLRRFFDFDENNSQQISAAYSVLKILLTGGISLVFTHHQKKQGPFKLKSSDIVGMGEAIRGSTDILAMCDTHLSVLPIERNEIAIVQTKQRDAEIVFPFKVSIVENDEGYLTFAYGGDFDEKENQKGKAKDLLLIEIKKNSPIMRTALVERFGSVISSGYFDMALKDLVNEGLVIGQTLKQAGIKCEGNDCRKKVFMYNVKNTGVDIVNEMLKIPKSQT